MLVNEWSAERRYFSEKQYVIENGLGGRRELLAIIGMKRTQGRPQQPYQGYLCDSDPSVSRWRGLGHYGTDEDEWGGDWPVDYFV